MRRVPLSALSIAVVDERIYALVKEGEILVLKILDKELKIIDEVISVKGHKGIVLYLGKGRALVSVDDKLLLIRNNEAEVVLTASKPNNTFWHSTEAKENVFIHEYGEPPTGIFVSKNLEDWERVATNLDIDRSSKHFHYIAYDPYREWLVTTLGDGCLTRVAVSEDLGSSWSSLYKGPWQFVPIVPLEDGIVFGMDSGIVRGGVGIYYPKSDLWKFSFFRWRDRRAPLAQMCDLKLLDDGLWVATFGAPQAITVSGDLNTWYPVYVESYDYNFNFCMSIAEVGNVVLCSTGNNLIAFDKSELHDIMMSSEPIATPYKAYKERLAGFGFNVKRLKERISLKL